jgi:hypothetical protein
MSDYFSIESRKEQDCLLVDLSFSSVVSQFFFRDACKLAQDLKGELIKLLPLFAQEVREMCQDIVDIEGGEWTVSCSHGAISAGWFFHGEEIVQITTHFPYDEGRASYLRSGDRFAPLDDLLTEFAPRACKMASLSDRLRGIFQGDFEQKYCIASPSTGGYSIRLELDKHRSIEVAIGPIDVMDCKLDIPPRRALVLLAFEYDPFECPLTAPYPFESEDEAVTWLESHLSDLVDPKEFDRVFDGGDHS